PPLVTYRNPSVLSIAIIWEPLPEPLLTVAGFNGVSTAPEPIEYCRMFPSLKFAAYRKVLLVGIAIPSGPLLERAGTDPTRVTLAVVVLRVNSEILPSLKLVTNRKSALPAVAVAVAVLDDDAAGKIDLPQETEFAIAAIRKTGGRKARILKAQNRLVTNF